MDKIAKGFRIALIQMKVGKNKTQNVEQAIEKIRAVCSEKQPKIVALPECFNSPYGPKYFPEYAERVPNGYTCNLLSEVAKELNIYLIGGTIPESEENSPKFYNTCTVWSPSGEMIAKHRKIHLFDIDVPGGIRFKESETLSAGNEFTVVDIDSVKIGIGICYDIRFEEMAKIYRKEGCQMLIYPSAFNMTTGPLHWELLQRARANDNQVFVATISAARDEQSDYVAWGHSMIVDPWGKVIESADEHEATIVADIDLSLVDNVRQQIPIFYQRRSDMYDTVKNKL